VAEKAAEIATKAAAYAVFTITWINIGVRKMAERGSPD
jgi:hypothetical protein